MSPTDEGAWCPLVTTTPSPDDGRRTTMQDNDASAPATFTFNHRGDGAKWSVSDFYEDFESELIRALSSGLDFDTGFYGVKKEIESGRIERRGDTIFVTVSVSDDFDCEGVGEVSFPAIDLTVDAVKAALDEALDAARENQRDNEVAALYLVGKDQGPGMSPWSFTFLRDMSGYDFESPPGDSYHRWGWQEVDTDDDSDVEAFPKEIGAEVAAKIAEAVFAGEVDDAGKDGVVIEGWRVRFARE